MVRIHLSGPAIAEEAGDSDMQHRAINAWRAVVGALDHFVPNLRFGRDCRGRSIE